jgi:hypothetical protein
MDKYVLYSFNMADVEDPDLFVSAPIYEWQQTPEGKFCMEKGANIKYHIRPDDYSYGYKVQVTGQLEPKHATWLMLKRT